MPLRSALYLMKVGADEVRRIWKRHLATIADLTVAGSHATVVITLIVVVLTEV
jgi:hypothetical protein